MRTTVAIAADASMMPGFDLPGMAYFCRCAIRKTVPCVSALLSAGAYSILAFSRSATPPLVLFALLLFSAPAGVTLRTLFAFHGFGDMTAPYIITAECCR